MATVLITGGTGMIGKHLTELLVVKGYDVIIVSRKKVIALPAKGVTATIRYKSIYKYQNAVVGKWSVEVVVPLYGHV